MKTLLLLMLFSISCYSQSLTEKWDSLMKRYNYYNSSGTLVGYKEYDKYDKAWKYYDVKQQVKQPRTDDNFDTYTKVALMREQKYQANKARIEATIVKLLENTPKLFPNETKQTTDVYNRVFYDVYVEPLNANQDLSNDELTNKIINELISDYNATMQGIKEDK